MNMQSIFQSAIKTILLMGFVAGTIDILSAIFLLAKGNADAVLRYVASGVFGEAAKQGDSTIAVYGLIFHYLIAFSFAIGYFYVYPKVPILHKNVLINAVFYGIFAWAFMRYIILPFTAVQQAPFSWASALKNAGILIYAIGLPIAYFTKMYYQNKK